MVKGISKQVIVVNSQDKSLFDQAIFILSDQAMQGNGVSNDALLREAKKIINNYKIPVRSASWHYFAMLLSGAFLMGLIWLITSFL